MPIEALVLDGLLKAWVSIAVKKAESEVRHEDVWLDVWFEKMKLISNVKEDRKRPVCLGCRTKNNFLQHNKFFMFSKKCWLHRVVLFSCLLFI